MTLYELQRLKNNYYNMKEQIGYIIADLSNTIDNLEIVIRNFNSAYSVDEDSNCRNEITNQKQKLVDRYNLLKNQVVPAINTQIAKIKKQIEEEQMKLT